MGDGIERALARAAELETLVANEVSALEHAYNDNEVRIRALLQDLGSQRDTLVGQAGQIRDAINSVHLDLSHDISQISELVAEQVNEASRRITHTLAEKGEHITRALMVNEPRLVVVHAERDVGKLLRLADRFTVGEMLAYIRFRRKVLLPILQGLTEKKWARTADKGLQRMESVYWAARGLALHELEHLIDLDSKLGK